MKYCPECGTAIEENAKYCPKCGHKITPVNHNQSPKVTTVNPKTVNFREYPQMNHNTVHSNSGFILIALVVIVVGFFIVQNKMVTTQEELAENVTKAVQKKDGKLFLKQFDQDNRKLKFANVGAQSVVDEFHSKATASTTEIGQDVADGRYVPGAHKYNFRVEYKKVLGRNSYYLVAQKVSVNFVADWDMSNLKFTLANGKEKPFTRDDFKAGVFPGLYRYNVTGNVGTTSVDQRNWVRLTGQESSYEIRLIVLN